MSAATSLSCLHTEALSAPSALALSQTNHGAASVGLLSLDCTEPLALTPSPVAAYPVLHFDEDEGFIPAALPAACSGALRL